MAEWYTRWSQKPMGLKPVRVRLSPRAPSPLDIFSHFLHTKYMAKVNKAAKKTVKEDRAYTEMVMLLIVTLGLAITTIATFR